MDVFEVLQGFHKESAVDTPRRPLVPAEKSNGVSMSRTREVSSRYRSPTPTNSRRCPSPSPARPLTRNGPSALSSSISKRAVSAERKRLSTPVSDTSAESQLSAKKVTGSRLPEGLWPSTMRSLSVSFQSDSIAVPVGKKKEKGKEKPVTSDRTLKPTSNVAQKEGEKQGASPRKPTPERKRSPIKCRHQSENSRPVESLQSKMMDQHRWPCRTGGRLASNSMIRSVDLTDRTGKIPSSSIPRRLSAEGVPRPLQKTATDGSEFDDHIGALGLRTKSVDDSLLRMSVRHKADSKLEKPTSAVLASSVRHGTVPGSRLSSPSRVSISRATPSPSKTRPSTPTQARGASPSRIRPSSPTRQSSSTASVLSFIADIKKGKKNNQLEEAHQLRLLYNRQLQWRFANARTEVALYIQKSTAEVKIS